MSFFGLKIQPFKGKASFQPGKMNLGDFIGSAGMVASGGIGKGMFDVAKWSTGNIAKNMGLQNGLKGFRPTSQNIGGMLNTANQFGVLGSTKGAAGNQAGGLPGNMAAIAQLLGNLGLQQGQFAMQNEPNRQRAVMGAYNSLDPSMIADDIMRYRQGAMAQGRNAGMQGMAALQAQGQSGAGALLDSLNRAAQMGNTYAANAGSSQARAGRYATQAGLFNADGAMSGMNALTQLLNAQNNQKQLNASLRQPSMLESLIPVLGSLAPYLKK